MLFQAIDRPQSFSFRNWYSMIEPRRGRASDTNRAIARDDTAAWVRLEDIPGFGDEHLER